MKRRDLLGLVGSSVMARWLTGCDRLVVLDSSSVLLIDPVTSNEDHYVYSVFPVPDVDPDSHETRVLHEDLDLASFDLAFLQTLPARDKEHTLECIGAGPGNLAISNAIWSGLPLLEVLDALGVPVPEGAVGMRLLGADRNAYTAEPYHAGLPVSVLTEDPAWLVWRMNGSPVPLVHGGPYRLLVPGRYGIKNVKWLTELAFVEVPHVSFWTERGWDEQALYNANALVIFPPDQLQVTAGQRLRFAGAAFAGTDPVVKVEISLDGGPFVEATLDYAPGPDIWALWSWDWTADPGEHTLAARCTTRSGATSHPSPEGTDPWHGYDGSMQITVIAT
jgi:DMSO/TMAO reductase YedYZ molybdopterin-dependent catalytic subunit